MVADRRATRLVFGVIPIPQRRYLIRLLRTETVGGLILLGAAAVALALANSPIGDTYRAVRDFHVGIAALGLDMSVAHWAADGLLTVFFLVAGIELKREVVVGELRSPSTAALPVIAAVVGMVVPAGLYCLVARLMGGSLAGWAVPMATDIAFALAVLAVVSTHLPAALRAFLLTLAVVDDMGAIIVIATFFTNHLNFAALGGAVLGLIVFYVLQRCGVRAWWVYVPLGLVIWALTLNSGVHATIGGVAMGLLTKAKPTDGEPESAGDRAAHYLHPISAGVAVPLFALFAAGVSLSGNAFAGLFTNPEPVAVMLALVVGKLIGIFGGTILAARFTQAELSPELRWADIFGVSALAGVGFTVSLLISELAFTDPALEDEVKAAVLLASLIAGAIAICLLRGRNRYYRREQAARMD